MKPRAFTLLETVLALFALVAAIVSLANLLYPLLHYQSRAEQQAMAGVAAERLLEEMRAAAATPAGFSGLTAAYNGTAHTYPEFPDVSLLAEVQPYRTFNPSRSLESPFASPKTVNGSLLRIRATASWSGKTLRLTSLVGEPPRLPAAVTVSVVGGTTLSPGATTDLTAELRDASGPIPDVTFSWSIRPVSGNGTIVPLTRDGATARLTNVYTDPSGSPIQAPGAVIVECRAIYYGVELPGTSVPVTLN